MFLVLKKAIRDGSAIWVAKWLKNMQDNNVRNSAKSDWAE